MVNPVDPKPILTKTLVDVKEIAISGNSFIDLIKKRKQTVGAIYGITDLVGNSTLNFNGANVPTTSTDKKNDRFDILSIWGTVEKKDSLTGMKLDAKLSSDSLQIGKFGGSLTGTVTLYESDAKDPLTGMFTGNGINLTGVDVDKGSLKFVMKGADSLGTILWNRKTQKVFTSLDNTQTVPTIKFSIKELIPPTGGSTTPTVGDTIFSSTFVLNDKPGMTKAQFLTEFKSSFWDTKAVV